MINDLEATKAAIIAASSLPMSIIIVGVGSADFSGQLLGFYYDLMYLLWIFLVCIMGFIMYSL